MIELGDILQVKQGERFIGLVTRADMDTATVVKFGRFYNNRQGTEEFEQGFIRARIRDGTFHKNGHADDLQEAVINKKRVDKSGEFVSMTPFTFDSAGTKSVYEDMEANEDPSALGSNAVLFDTHNNEWRTVVEAGWRSDGLANDLLRMGDGSVESVSTVVQAMQKGLWLLMCPKNQKIQGNSNVDVDLEIDSETGKILK